MTLHLGQTLTQIEDFFLETAPVAMIRQDIAAISEQNNLSFIKSYDDLDDLEFATLPLHSRSPVGLVRHEHSPVSGLEIFVRHDEQDIALVISETLYELNLTPDDLIWVHPNYQEQLDVYIKEQAEHRARIC